VLNRDVFQKDPEEYRIPNDGVAKIAFPPPPGTLTETLAAELRTFITDGEFGRGLLRILESFRSGLGHGSQKAVWISGFYGSGKSHLAKMLCALWTDQPFPDGSRPTALLPEPSQELLNELRGLRTAGERAGGRDEPILRYLRALEVFDRAFPGFAHDIHGVEDVDGAYMTYCMKEGAL